MIHRRLAFIFILCSASACAVTEHCCFIARRHALEDPWPIADRSELDTSHREALECLIEQAHDGSVLVPLDEELGVAPLVARERGAFDKETLDALEALDRASASRDLRAAVASADPAEIASSVLAHPFARDVARFVAVRGGLLFERGDFEEAARELERAIALGATDERIRGQLERARACAPSEPSATRSARIRAVRGWLRDDVHDFDATPVLTQAFFGPPILDRPARLADEVLATAVLLASSGVVLVEGHRTAVLRFLECSGRLTDDPEWLGGLDASSGRVLWATELPETDQDEVRADGALPRATLASGERVFLLRGRRVIALELRTGRVLWMRRCRHASGLHERLALDGSALVLSATERLDVRTGARER